MSYAINTTTQHNCCPYAIIQAYKKPARCISSRRHGRYFRGVTTMESIPRTSGVYQILCTPTGKMYIGSAVNLRRRKNDHWMNLRNKQHGNPYLQNAWNKYGEDALEFSVIELVLSPFLTAREQYWMDRLHVCDRKKGFNILSTAGSPFGSKASDETRQRMRAAHVCKKMPPFSSEHRLGIAERARARMALA